MNNHIKSIAFYLPQYHRVKENDDWWGEGFTEWTAVKKAVPLFEGHRQPRIPLHEYYYDLMDKSAMQWQVDIAKKYRIDGFCFYHYWFKDGRKILEKPVENFLQWKDLDINFCLSWANESWARSWSNIPKANTWANRFEEKKCALDDGILLEQEYGNEQQWIDHIMYLLPYFQDNRYIKYEGKPVFIIYRPLMIDCILPMIECWEKVVIDYGFPGLYLIGTNMPVLFPPFEANLIQLPGCIAGIHETREIEGGAIRVASYDYIWQYLLNCDIDCSGKDLLCGLVDYDNSPRNGRNALVVYDNTAEKFQEYFTALVRKSILNNNSFVFLNAWNEWGEGNYLEPDETVKYAYLEAVKIAMTTNVQAKTIPKISEERKQTELRSKIIKGIKTKSYKFERNYNLLYKWIKKKQSHQEISDYFIQHGYRKVAIYGMGELGKLLYTEINREGLTILYFIDQKGNELHNDIPVFSPTESYFPPVDVVIVSIIDEFPYIYNAIRKKMKADIISLDTVVSG